MATAIRLRGLAQAFPEGFACPTREQVQDRVRQARRAVKQARNTVEDTAADASVVIRHNPLTAVAVAAGTGVVLGAAAVGVVTVVRRLAGRCCD